MRHKSKKCETQADMAKKRGVSEAAISKAKRRHFGNRKVDAETLEKTLDAGRRMDKANPPPDYMEARARLTDEQAREAKRENDLEEGKLHRDDDCDRARMEEAQIIRAELLNLGNKLAPELGETADQQRRCKVVLDRWADETLTGWAAWANGKRGKA